jgi:hypothetical protein
MNINDDRPPFLRGPHFTFGGISMELIGIRPISIYYEGEIYDEP